MYTTYKEIWKLVRHSLNVLQVVAYTLSACVGLCILFFAVYCYFDYTQYIKKDAALFAKEFVVVSKKVSMLQTITQTHTYFSQREIQEIKKQKFFTAVDAFESSQFTIKLYTDSDKLPPIRTDLFFESVPNQYIQADMIDWHWREGQTFIPIIFPQNFLSLYNYGFAPGQGLPQLSESVFTKIPLKIKITGNGLQQIYDARVVGFSQRINTILVPQTFLLWANKTYAQQKSVGASRLILACDNIANPKIFEYITRKNFQIQDESLVNSKLAFYLKLTLSVVGFIGLLITFLAVWLLIFSFQLILEKNKEKIQNLHYLGFSIREIAAPYMLLSIGITAILALIAGIVSYVVHAQVINVLEVLIEIPNPSIAIAGVITIFTCTLVCVIHVYAIRTTVAGICSK